MDSDSRLHPPLEPFDIRRLAVDGTHTLHVEQIGNAKGLPCVFLHGGPGSGCNPEHRRLFAPDLFRAVLFDQRGAGRSTPKRCLIANTTQDLVADMERIRAALGIDRWMLVGGSWGATLALAYAQAHPERTLGIVLRAVFLGTREEFRWAFESGPQILYPDLWRRLLAALPEGERGDPIAALGRRIENPDPRVHAPAAQVWHDFERSLSVLRPGSLALPALDQMPRGEPPNTPFLEWHFLRHDCYLAPGQLLEEAWHLRRIPGIIVQGRYDLLCPPQAAHDLALRWDDAALRIVAGAGHAASEPMILSALVTAIREMGMRLAR